MVRIRLARHGTKKRPFYRIVAAESECRRDGRFIEVIGTYNPLSEPAQIAVNPERVRHWVEQGAIPTDTVRTLLKKGKFLETPAES
jgi:small subunit ribosomal protein S16